MNPRGLSMVSVVAALALFAAVPVSASAQQVEVLSNPLDDPSDIATWYNYADGLQWAVDDTPIAGHNSPMSLNLNNGTDIFNYNYYVYTYMDTEQFDVSGETNPTLSFWCRQSWPTDPDVYKDQVLYLFGPTAFAQLYFGSDLNCGQNDTWHQHTIDLSQYGFDSEPFQMEFYVYCDWWYWENYLGGSSADYQGWFIDQLQVLVPDVTPPDPITDLAAGNASLTEMEVTWSAPSDDDISGVVATYDLRMSTSPITGTNFDNATEVSGEPAPAVAGTPHTLLITGLTQDTTYYFALRTTDVAGNVSNVSNVASLATLAPPPPPPPPMVAPEEPKDPRANDVLPCSAGTTSAPVGVLLLGGLIALAALGLAIRK